MNAASSQPLITTIIATYRRPAMLHRAVRSVLNQSFPDFRVCIYDNASGDETAILAAEFRRQDSRVEYVCRPNNIGSFANFTDGANRVTTPFFSFLADDDLMLPHFFEVALTGFHQHPEAAMSILTTIRMNAAGFALGAPVLQWPEGLLSPPAGMLSILRFGNPDLPGLLIRRKVWEELRGWDEMIGATCDLDFELRVAARFPVVVSKQLGGVLLIHSKTITSGACLDWVWPSFPRMANKLVRDVNIPPAARQEAAETLTRWLKKNLVTRGMIQSIIRGNWEEAEKAASLFLQECRWTRVAGIVRPVSAVCQRLPGMRWTLQALLAARASVSVIRHLGLQWRFWRYSKMLTVSWVEPPRSQL